MELLILLPRLPGSNDLEISDLADMLRHQVADGQEAGGDTGITETL